MTSLDIIIIILSLLVSSSKEDNGKNGDKECSGGEEKDEIDITTSEDITDKEPPLGNTAGTVYMYDNVFIIPCRHVVCGRDTVVVVLVSDRFVHFIC